MFLVVFRRNENNTLLAYFCTNKIDRTEILVWIAGSGKVTQRPAIPVEILNVISILSTKKYYMSITKGKLYIQRDECSTKKLNF